MSGNKAFCIRASGEVVEHKCSATPLALAPVGRHGLREDKIHRKLK